MPLPYSDRKRKFGPLNDQCRNDGGTAFELNAKALRHNITESLGIFPECIQQEISDHLIDVWITSHQAMRWKQWNPILDIPSSMKSMIFFSGCSLFTWSFRESNVQLCEFVLFFEL